MGKYPVIGGRGGGIYMLFFHIARIPISRFIAPGEKDGLTSLPNKDGTINQETRKYPGRGRVGAGVWGPCGLNDEPNF